MIEVHMTVHFDAETDDKAEAELMTRALRQFLFAMTLPMKLHCVYDTHLQHSPNEEGLICLRQ